MFTFLVVLLLVVIFWRQIMIAVFFGFCGLMFVIMFIINSFFFLLQKIGGM